MAARSAGAGLVPAIDLGFAGEAVLALVVAAIALPRRLREGRGQPRSRK